MGPGLAASPEQILIRMGLAVVLGALIGVEREYRSRPAGLRTHMLVALAACSFMVIATGVFTQALGFGPTARIDLLRIIEAVTAGVAFLAAGTIITARGHVSGLTTGASLWLTGAVGLGYYFIALAATGFALTILVAIRLLERVMPKKDDSKDQ
ncbi:MAG: MgtC/SapB family protein [Alphaproteobacteria bacterium]|nr:MgtC/SapB family protein [Alphaproteobacteria bacterium]